MLKECPAESAAESEGPSKPDPNQPSRSETPNLRLIDFLFPKRMMAETGADDNPFLVQSQRRSRRFLRFVFLRLLEILILLPAGFVLTPGVSSRILWLFFLITPFVLLRYHLLASDQSHHLKALTREQLEHLLLTRLTSKEYFLHPLLAFCLRYGIVVALVAVFAVQMAIGVIFRQDNWVYLGYYQPISIILMMVLLTWIAGACQFIFEWRRLSGGRYPVYRQILSLFFSVGFSIPVVLICLYFQGQHPLKAIIAVPLLFIGAAWMTWQYGRSSFSMANDLLWQRYLSGDADARVYMHPKKENAFMLALNCFFPRQFRKSGHCFLLPIEKSSEAKKPASVLDLIFALSLVAICAGTLAPLIIQAPNYQGIASDELFLSLLVTGAASLVVPALLGFRICANVLRSGGTNGRNLFRSLLILAILAPLIGAGGGGYILFQIHWNTRFHVLSLLGFATFAAFFYFAQIALFVVLMAILATIRRYTRKRGRTLAFIIFTSVINVGFLSVLPWMAVSYLVGLGIYNPGLDFLPIIVSLFVLLSSCWLLQHNALYLRALPAG